MPNVVSTTNSVTAHSFQLPLAGNVAIIINKGLRSGSKCFRAWTTY